MEQNTCIHGDHDCPMCHKREDQCDFGDCEEKAQTRVNKLLATFCRTFSRPRLFVRLIFARWRHIFRMRDSKNAHPDMRSLMAPLHEEFRSLIPIIFD